MSYKPSRKSAQGFSIVITILGIIIVKEAHPGSPSIDGMNFQPPAYFGVGLIIVGIAGIILLGSGLAKKIK